MSAGAAFAQPQLVGDEIPVNQRMIGPQRNVDVCTREDGSFVVVWEDGRANSPSEIDHGADGSETAVCLRGLAANDSFGPELLVNGFGAGRQDDPQVACLSGGGVAVVWTERASVANAAVGRYRISARVYDSPTDATGSEFEVSNPDGYGGAYAVDGNVCAGPGDGFVVVWRTAPPLRAGVQRYDADGVAQGTMFTVPASSGAMYPACCSGNDGFIVTWTVQAAGLDHRNVMAHRFDDDGMASGTEFIVNAFTANAQTRSDVACSSDGRFVVAWEAYASPYGGSPPDGDGLGVFARTFNASGVALDEDFQVNVSTAGDQYEAAVAMDDAGRFIVAWTTTPPGTERIFAREFDADGDPVGGELQVNTFTLENSSTPSAAVTAGGDAVVAWHTSNDSDDHSVSAQRLALPNACGDTDRNGRVTATDALFVLGVATAVQVCDLAVCDVNDDGGITASDALIVLRVAVSLPGVLVCPVA